MSITNSNCNYWLNRFYKERDRISISISAAEAADDQPKTKILEREYNRICDLIDTFLQYRRYNPCLTEGDKGYGPV